MIKKFLRTGLTLGWLVALCSPALPAFAASASITLSAYDLSVAKGSSVVIAVYMNGGGHAVNAVEADLHYSTAQLQYVGFSATGSAFEIGASSGGGGGTATLDRGTVGSVKGSGLVGTVTFRALASSGSAPISVASSSSLVAGGSSIAYSTTGVSLQLTAAGTVSSSPANTATSSAPSTTPTQVDTKPPHISNLKISQLSPYGATVTWTTNESATSAVEFGVDTHYGLSDSTTKRTKHHKVVLDSSFLQPEVLLHYRVKSADAAGNVATSKDQHFELPGVPFTVIVRGASGQPQAGVAVTLGNASGTTDKNGRVTLPASLGRNQLTTFYQGENIQRTVTVNRSSKPLAAYELDLAKQPLNRWMLLAIGLLVAVLTLLGIDAVLFGSHFFRRMSGLHHKTPRLPVAPVPTPAAPPRQPPVVTKPMPAPKPAVAPEPHELPVSPQAQAYVDSLAIDTTIPDTTTTPIATVEDIKLSPPVTRIDVQAETVDSGAATIKLKKPATRRTKATPTVRKHRS
ncbi:MAG TPA: hypothetical protein VG992_03075 [Candidatus Saccharimonadales bacterium]|nr:hypothetical protein [Candidatus Saccharimonadales bacterium]